MEDKQRICEICNKRFANGKAMGGHMRSHMAKLPVPTTKRTQTPPLYTTNFISTPPPPSSSSSLIRTYRWSSASTTTSHPHFISMINDDHQSLDDIDSHHEPTIPRRRRHKSPSLERNSDTDNSSPRNPTPKRLKRQRLRRDSPSFGFSDDEEVAMCLMKLSRDKWTTTTKTEMIRIMKPVNHVGEDDNQDQAAPSVSRRRRTYKCETCNKLFRSYQALGGHRASHKHKKLKLSSCKFDGDDDDYQYDHGHNYDLNTGDYDDLLDLNFLPEDEEEEEVSKVSNADFR